jgi:indolepyruvate ferredoxin oxidoreductase alpha subunit
VERVLLSGNEAVARGAWEAGVAVGVGYPGTPSTEVLESLAVLGDAHSEWAPNEKVALEVAAGVSLGGRRVLVTMKHVGLNVAADPLFTLAYTGVGGGLVILVADDPGMHSSQNEQDTRMVARAAKVPVLEPSDSQEALRMTKAAFEASERFDLPFIVRSSTRISHSKGLVELAERIAAPCIGTYATDARKYVMMPGNARVRRVDLESRLENVSQESPTLGVDRAEMRDPDFGVITSGVAYWHVREALPDASVLKLGLTNPLTVDTIRDFAESVGRVAIVEELDPYLEGLVRGMGVEVEATSVPRIGELTARKVAEGLGVEVAPLQERIEGLPGRPPVMCPGCPHRGVFYALKRMRAVVSGDIGCYTLAALPPLSSMDTCVCMGASIGLAHGLELATCEGDRPVVAVIGDSTFAHSGLTGLANAVYNGGDSTIVVLDNRTTAMTGHQDNPVTGRTLMGDETAELDVGGVGAALGAASVRTIDPHDLSGAEEVLREEVARPGVSLVVAKAPCALLLKDEHSPVGVDDEACTACGVCIRLGCPAISTAEDGKAFIDVALCVGCGQCEQVCKFDAIVPAGSACDIGGGMS